MKNLASQDGELYLLRGFLPQPLANQFYTELHDSLCWQEETLIIAGKRVLVPRLVAWYGDDDACYRYSSVAHEPLPWIPPLLSIKAKIEQQTGTVFNSVLANLYRNGNDSLGWHADKEKELGQDPAIASLSLGAQRLFKIRHNKSKAILTFNLQHGDLLLMAGRLQHYWRHCVPKISKLTDPRVNLTYRYILPSSMDSSC